MFKGMRRKKERKRSQERNDDNITIIMTILSGAQHTKKKNHFCEADTMFISRNEVVWTTAQAYGVWMTDMFMV